MAMLPLESAQLISQLSKDVKINYDGLKAVSEVIKSGLKEENYSISKWKEHELHPKAMDSGSVDWIFFVDTLNFSFWSRGDEKYEVKYNDKTYSGYWSLCAAVNRALQEGIPILSAEYYSTISLETLKHVFRSETGVEIPLLQERLKILNDTGKCLIEKFNGSFTNVLALCENSAKKLLHLIIHNFSSYKDEAEFCGYRVSFYKRAQILIADIWACFEGKSYGAFNDIDVITMFADYRVPQTLAYFKALEYSEHLMEALSKGQILKNGDRFEVEIRGCSIWAVEKICQLINKEGIQESSPKKMVNAILADYYLWDYRRKHASEMESIPFHKTECIYY